MVEYQAIVANDGFCDVEKHFYGRVIALLGCTHPDFKLGSKVFVAMEPTTLLIRVLDNGVERSGFATLFSNLHLSDKI